MGGSLVLASKLVSRTYGNFANRKHFVDKSVYLDYLLIRVHYIFCSCKSYCVIGILAAAATAKTNIQVIPLVMLL